MTFSDFGSLASIISLIVGIVGTGLYCKFSDKSSNKLIVTDANVGGDLTGRDKTGRDKTGV